MILKPDKTSRFTDWLTEPLVAIVRVETQAEHLARVHERFLERKQEMGKRYLLHPANQVKRLDGKVYGAKESNNVRPLARKEKRAA